jgi:hypothetical protein
MPGSVHKERAIPHCLGSYSDFEPTAGGLATRTLVVRCLACCRWALALRARILNLRLEINFSSKGASDDAM